MWVNNLLKIRNYFKISSCYRNYTAIASVLEKANVGEFAEVKGWVKNLRVQKELIFADVTDGSSAKRLQIVIPKKLKTDALTYGSSVHITGTLSSEMTF